MDQRRTLTMSWDGLGDLDNDDEDLFFDAQRLSAVAPQDLGSSSDDDEEFDDSRMSFSSTVAGDARLSTASAGDSRLSTVSAADIPTGDYDMWMAAPESINDRRRRLLQDMGLVSSKDFFRSGSTKLTKALSKLSRKHDSPPPATTTGKNVDNPITPPAPGKKSSPPPVEHKHNEHRQPVPVPQQRQLPTSLTMLVRSRSDGNIDTSSFNTKRRKEEMIGSISKQKLTRTSSGFMSNKLGQQHIPSLPNNHINDQKHNNGGSQNEFLIKNLDTGKEFVVKEFSSEGMWHKLSDLQTGKQLTMDEFEKSVGHSSPAVKELMRRGDDGKSKHGERKLTVTNSAFRKSFRKSTKRGVALLKNIKGSMGHHGSKKDHHERDHTHRSKKDHERDHTTVTATVTDTVSTPAPSDDNNNSNLLSGEHKPSSRWVKAQVYGKPYKEFTALHQSQEIQAHDGSIWAMKFTYDGHYLATAGEDAVIQIWEVQECDVMAMQSGDAMSLDVGTPVHSMAMVADSHSRPPLPNSTPDRKKKGKHWKKKGGIPDYVHVPETVFALSEIPFCSLKGHEEDVLDLSWSRSHLLLSSSMDKTVRLWDIETKNCLKLFSHSDYVTCTQFNPADDDYFISGSLDNKVRIWNIPHRQVVDWTDLHEMVTAVGYSPDGKGAVVGSHKGICRFYDTTECKLELKDQIELRTKKKPQPKKITGFQFSTWNPSEVLVTSADSRIRILDGTRIVQKFIGYKNNNSQFLADYSPDGKYVISSSEDSQVYMWRYEETQGKSKRVITRSYEHFPCKEVSVTAPWPGSSKLQAPLVEMHSKRHSKKSTTAFPPPAACSPSRDDITSHSKRISSSPLPPLPKKGSPSMESNNIDDVEGHHDSSIGPTESFHSASGASVRYDDNHDILASPANSVPRSWSKNEGGNHDSHAVQATAWGLVIVTAGLGGEIKVYQNVGLPFKVGGFR